VKKIFVATYPFGLCGEEPIKVLNSTEDIEIVYNSLGRRLESGEVGDLLCDAHGVIAGTEPYTVEELDKAENLEVISRVGVGLDNVDFQACRDRGITVTFTPEPPADSVADLTIAQMVNLLRGVYHSDRSVHKGLWDRVVGYLVSEVKIGILGVGRIGTRVIKRLKPFGANVYACDTNPNYAFGKQYGVKWVEKNELFEICDLVSIHIPMNEANRSCVGFKELSRMKEGSFLINTARGPIIDEQALESIMINKHLGGVALDVFWDEPYRGTLTQFDNVILTAHLGGSAHYSRYLMELGAAIDCVKVLHGLEPDNLAVES